MGFRDFYGFNLAMLGKQGWKLISDPNATICRIYKAKYYPRGDFLNAKLGHNPSFAWRSILASQVVLKRGYRWRIGDGSYINIWKEPWLRDPSNLFIEKPMIPELQHWTVKELMIPGTRDWDHDVIEAIFEDRDSKAITEIPIRQSQTIDHRIWHFSKTGVYTVKSGYHVAMSMDVHSESRKIQGNWKEIWKLEVPPRIKAFLWRACRECLPHRINLQKRGIQVPSLCVVCNKDLENSWDTFISCPFARDCWENAKVLQTIEAQADGAEGFTQWIFKIIKEVSGAEMNKIATILWAIWKQRNSLLWNNHIDIPSRAVDTALSFLYDWISVGRSEKDSQKAGTKPQVSLWTAPPNGAVKCNIDAAFFEDIQTAGVSMVIRDAEGKFVIARTTLVKGLRCVKEGEAIGLLEALSWIRNLDYPTVMFEVDAQTVHLAMRGNEKDNTEFGGIIENCRSIVASKPGFSVHFVRRQANEVAHVLAKQSRFYDSPFVWVETPTCIGELMNLYFANSSNE